MAHHPTIFDELRSQMEDLGKTTASTIKRKDDNYKNGVIDCLRLLRDFETKLGGTDGHIQLEQ
jgi:hypothetical protein